MICFIHKYINIIRTFVLAMVFSGCQPEIREFEPSNGGMDFSSYVAIGCGNTAGFTDGELFRSAQIVSYPNIISRQLIHLGGGEFKQPLMFDEHGFGNRLFTGFLPDCDGDSNFVAIADGALTDEANYSNLFAEFGPFYNLGVPGASIFELNQPYNQGGSRFYSYASRLASDPSSSILNDVGTIQPGFFTLWIGLADILQWTSSTALNDTITLNFDDFEQAFSEIITELDNISAGGAIANIPNIFMLPWFSHLQADGLWALDSIGGQPYQLTGNDFILLSASENIKCNQAGSEDNPLERGYFIPSEMAGRIQQFTDSINVMIRAKALQHNLALVDINKLYRNIEQGTIYEGIPFSNAYIHGGFFSVDGVHLTARANALIANEFITAINAKYNSVIPLVSITQFPGVEYP